MRQMDISIGVILQNDQYVLQRRGEDPAKGAAGKIGAFGGKIEPDESPEKAVCREIAEESSFRPAESQLRYIGSYVIMSDYQLEEVSVNVEVFEIDAASDVNITAEEGKVVRLNPSQVPEMLHRMTSATRYFFEEIKGVKDVSAN